MYGHQAVEVVEHVGIAEDGSAPVLVDAELESCVGLCDLALQGVHLHGMYRRVARVLHIDGVVGEAREIGGMLGHARRLEALEVGEDVLAGMRNDPVTVHGKTEFEVAVSSRAHRILFICSSRTRCSACLTAMCRRSASQGHSGSAGALQMAQFGAKSISARIYSDAAGIITEHAVLAPERV